MAIESRPAALFEVAKLLASEFDLDKLLSMILSEVHKVMGAQSASLMLRVEGKDELAFVDTRGDTASRILSRTVKFGQGISGEAAQSQRIINVLDAWSDERFDSSFDKESGFRTRQMLVAPMVHQNEVVGVISVLNTLTGKAFTLEDERILKIFCDQASIALINAYKYDNLELIVAERTKAIATITNNVQTGIFLIDRDMRLQDGFTTSCLHLVGPHLKTGQNVLEALGVRDSHPDFDLHCEQIFDDMMPEEVSLGQLPERIAIDDKVLTLAGSVVRDENDQVQLILFTLVDATDFVRTESENLKNQALIKILREREAFDEFFQESIDALRAEYTDTEDAQKYWRVVFHTIKGNAGMFGLNDVAHHIHMQENSEKITQESIDSVTQRLFKFHKEHQEVLGPWKDHDQEHTQISESQVSELVQRTQTAVTVENLREEVAQWADQIMMKPALQLLGPVETFVDKLAEKLFKNVRVKIDGGDTLMDKEVMAPVLKNLTHVIRNCLDHGLEADRGDKDPVGTLFISFGETDSGWRIEIGDDGAGIDVDKVCESALKNGYLKPEALNKMSHEEKLRLIFADGLSSAGGVSEVSGRGVGMSALLRAVEARSGSIAIESVRNERTRFCIEVPSGRSVEDKTLRAS